MLSQFTKEIKEIFRYKDLIRNLVVKDMRVKYRNSVFGYIWSLMNPLVVVAMYVFVFKYLLNVGERKILVITGVLFYQFFAGGLNGGVLSFVGAGSLYQKVNFPRIIPLISKFYFSLIEHIMIYPFLLIALLIWDCPMTWNLLWFPILLFMLSMFIFGLSLFLGTINIFFRDVTHILEVFLKMLFWLTPIIYSIQRVPEKIQWVIRLTPMTPFILAIRQVLCLGSGPDWNLLLQCMAYSSVTMIAGVITYLKLKDRLVEGFSN